MTTKRKFKQDKLTALQQLLIPALTMLDLRGTDDRITKALIITNQAIKSVNKGNAENPDRIFSQALEIFEQQKA
jgi:hypothetical protein